MSKLATHPQQKTNALRTAAKNKTRPRLAGLCPIGFRQTPSPGHARAFDIFAACAPGAGCGIQCQWGMGRPAGGCVFVFAAGARRLFFAVGAQQVHSLTCCPPSPSIHCRKKSRVRGAFLFGCGCASLLTHALPAARSTRSKKNTGSALVPASPKA